MTECPAPYDLFVLRSVFKLFKVMNSETAAESLAAALALGTFLGFVPLFSLQGVVVVLAVLFLRVNVTLALATMLATTLLAGVLEPTLHGIGIALLEREGWIGLWTAVDGSAVLSAMRLTNSVTLGGTLVGAAALVPVGLAGLAFVRFYRDRVEGWILRSRLFTFLKSLRIYSLYRTLTSPFA